MFTSNQQIQYRKPKVGWVDATVVVQDRKDLVIRVSGMEMNTKIAMKYVNGDNSPIRTL